MVQVLRPTGYKVVARFEPRPKAGSPLIVIPTAPSGAIVLAARAGQGLHRSAPQGLGSNRMRAALRRHRVETARLKVPRRPIG